MMRKARKADWVQHTHLFAPMSISARPAELCAISRLKSAPAAAQRWGRPNTIHPGWMKRKACQPCWTMTGDGMEAFEAINIYRTNKG